MQGMRGGSEPVDDSGRPYHLLWQTGRSGRWRVLAELLAFLVVTAVLILIPFGFVGLVGASLGVAHTDGLAKDQMWQLAQVLVGIAMLIPAVAATVTVVGRRRFGTVSSVAGQLRWRQLRGYMLPAVLVNGGALVAYATRYGWDPDLWPGWRTWLAAAAIAVTLTPFQAAAEEYVCRGWLVQALVRWTRLRWIAAALASAAFVTAHLYTNPWVIADLSAFALVLCLVTFRTGGLEAAIVYHAVWNITLLLFNGSQGIIVPPAEIEPDVSAVDTLISVAASVLYAVWVLRRPGAAQVRSAPGDGVRVHADV
jgi:CAAX protease family protein